MDLIVYAHHGGESHNAKLLSHVKEQLKSMDREFEVIDLYAENFNPVMPTVSYSDENLDEKVTEYQQKISKASRLIIIFPIWWYNAPAMVKGFFDRVFTSGFAFKFGPAGPEPLLADKTAVVINTFGGPKQGLEMFGNAPVMAIDKAILEFCGLAVTRINWFNCRRPDEIPDDVKAEIDSALRR
jgi:NAD(P)H dehydrogenase (quinone)